MIENFFQLGGVEIANSTRTAAYLESIGSPLTSGASVCGCPTMTATSLGDAAYTTPDADPAPWYDPDVPESADFAGLLVLSVEGLDDFPVRRSVTNSVTGGGVLGPARVQPRTITVTGILLGVTCCAVAYGLHWLGEALQGCDGSGGGCEGDCLSFYNCCPGEELAEEVFNQEHRRTLLNAALVEGPTVLSRVGDGCTTGECQIGADIIEVEMVFTATTPWAWTDVCPTVELPVPTDDGSCITWCVHPPVGEPAEGCDGPCRLADCVDPTAACADPNCQPPAPPVPGTPSTCYCLPLAVNEECCELDLSDHPKWAVDIPVITVRAGSSDLRRVTISFHERTGDGTCEDIAADGRCTPHSVYTVQYLPAGGVLTLDGRTGRSTVECGGTCEGATSVWGADGAPPSFAGFTCDLVCMCVTSDALFPPAADATVAVGIAGRGY